MINTLLTVAVAAEAGSELEEEGSGRVGVFCATVQKQ